MKFNTKLGSAVAIATFVASVVSPAAFADTTVNVSGNGAFSHTYAAVKNIKKTYVAQSNKSVVLTGIKAKTSTGGNTASFNTGGDTAVNTGNATTNVNVSVGGSSNTATLPNCGCDTNTSVNVSGNGAFSHNGVNVVNKNVTAVSQTNESFVATGVDVSTKTGNNSASFNTGGATVITTGDSTSNVSVNVTGSSNTLNP